MKDGKKWISGKPLAIIVAIAENYAIGLNNRLLWHISDDLKRFKKLTEGHTVVMGKKTYESLPVRPLKNRRNIVITDSPEEKFEGCLTVHSVEEAISLCDPYKMNFIIGGASIYRQFLPLADMLYLTRVHKSFHADTFFPEISAEDWQCVSSEPGPEDPALGFAYTYEIYTRTDK